MTNKKLKHLQNHIDGIKSTIEELKIINKNKMIKLCFSILFFI